MSLNIENLKWSLLHTCRWSYPWTISWSIDWFFCQSLVLSGVWQLAMAASLFLQIYIQLMTSSECIIYWLLSICMQSFNLIQALQLSVSCRHLNMRRRTTTKMNPSPPPRTITVVQAPEHLKKHTIKNKTRHLEFVNKL